MEISPKIEIIITCIIPFGEPSDFFVVFASLVTSAVVDAAVVIEASVVVSVSAVAGALEVVATTAVVGTSVVVDAPVTVGTSPIAAFVVASRFTVADVCDVVGASIFMKDSVVSAATAIV